MKQNLRNNHNFFILVIGQIISLFGSAIQRFALSLYLLDITGSATIFSSILALSMIPVVVVAPFAGVIADRADKKKVMVILDFLSAIFISLYAVTLFQGNITYMYVGILMVALSVFSTIYQPTVNASIPLMVEDEQLMTANSVVQQVASLSNFLGPILAGVIYGLFGIKVIITLNAVSFVISAILESFMKIPYVKNNREQSIISMFAMEMKESLRYLKNDNPVVLRMVMTSGLYNLFLVPIFSVGAPYIIKVSLGMSSYWYGVAEGVIAIGMILGAFIVSSRSHIFRIENIYKILYGSCISMFLMGISLLLISSSTANYLLFTLFGMGIMVSIGAANVVSMTFTQTVTPTEMLGKVMAFGSAFATVCIPIGQVLFGTMLDYMKDHIFLLVILASIFTTVVTLLVRWNVKQVK